ncbi:MAG TPA: glycosyltransferase [Solirubrobacteraceae bacterium]|jgi:glycosyltransferase involved in cell wall biosynthesis|nr:glycosyltransferase [Solirubrobacteraceae bacterium]
MRVCVVYDCLFPYTVGGGERWYRAVAERAGREGHEVTYLTLRQWERGERADVGPGVRVVAVGPRMALYTEGGRRRILPPLVFGLGVLWHLLRHGRRYEVVDTCAFPYFSLLAAALVRPLWRYRLIVEWFEVWSAAYWREYLGALAGPMGMAVQRMCALVPQRAICFSRLHAARLRQEGLRGEVEVLRGLYTGASRTGEPAEATRTVLFAGRLIPEKRVTLAVAALAAAARRLPGLRGVILGDGPEREALLQAVREHGLQDVVETPGFTAGERVEHETAQALCMLLTSRREGYGMVVVEAAAQGTPSVVVAGEDNAATELISEGENGFVAGGADPEKIGQAIVDVHDAGAALRASTLRWFAEHSSELSLEASLRRVLEVYAG